MSAAGMLYEEGKPHPTRPMGYAALLGIPSLIMGKLTTEQYINWGIFLNVLAWLLTIFYLHKSLELFLNSRWALGGTVFFVLCMGNLFHNSLVLTETWTCLFITFSCYFLFKSHVTGQDKYAASAVAMLCLSVMFRPGMYYLALLFLLGLVAYFLFRKKLKYLLNASLLLALGLVLVQNFAIKTHYGNFTPSYVDKTTWFNYLGTKVHAVVNEQSYQEAMRQRQEAGDLDDWKSLSRTSTDDLKRTLMDHPWIFWRSFVKISSKTRTMVVTHSNTPARSETKTQWYLNSTNFYSSSQEFKMRFSLC
jgi:hypothetical protein